MPWLFQIDSSRVVGWSGTVAACLNGHPLSGLRSVPSYGVSRPTHIAPFPLLCSPSSTSRFLYSPPHRVPSLEFFLLPDLIIRATLPFLSAMLFETPSSKRPHSYVFNLDLVEVPFLALPTQNKSPDRRIFALPILLPSHRCKSSRSLGLLGLFTVSGLFLSCRLLGRFYCN